MLPKTNNYIKQAYDIACQHGFYKEKLSVEHCLMLVITEIAEAIEADRKDKQADVEKFRLMEKEDIIEGELFNDAIKDNPDWDILFEATIKDTFADELADIYIRLCETAGMLGIEYEQRIIDTDASNLSASISNEKRLTEKMFTLISILTNDEDLKDLEKIGSGLFFIEWLANYYNIDLAWHVEMKMKYNEMRPKMHGKKY